MQKFLVRRFLVAIVTVIVVSLVIFIMSRAAGDPRALLLDDYSTMEDWDRLGEALGLDKPYYQQYGIFIKDALRGEFGESIQQGRPAMHIVLEHLPATLQLATASFALSLLIGVPLGIISAVKRGSLVDQFGRAVALVGQSAPPFWLGIMLMFFFSVHLGWVPPYGREDPRGVILPAITLGWFQVAALMRLVRSAMLEVQDTEYVTLARVKGIAEWKVIWKHCLRNAAIPPLTLFGILAAQIMTGAIVTESVFSWPGTGLLAVDAIRGRDYPVIQAVVVLFSVIYITMNLVIDIVYAYLDPRIRYGDN